MANLGSILGGGGTMLNASVGTYGAMEQARLEGMKRQILQAQLQEQQDLRRASLASMLDQSGGVDPTAATLMALGGGQDPSQGGGQPGMGGGPGMSPGQPQTMPYSLNQPPPQQQQMPWDQSQPPPQAMPMGGAGGPSSQQIMPDAISGSPGMSAGGGMNMPPQPGASVTPTPNIGSPQSPMTQGGGQSGMGGMSGMPGMSGGQMSLGQMFQRLRADPKNQGIPDTTLFQMATKAQQAMMPADRMLLQYMMHNQITPYQQAQLGARADQTAATNAYRASMMEFMRQKDVQMMPGMGPDPKDPTKQIPGAYVFDKANRSLQFMPTGGAMGAGAVAAAAKGDKEAGALIDKDTAKMIADRAKAGDSTAMSGLGFGNTGAKNRALVYKALQEQGVTGTDLAKATIAFRGAAQAVKSVETQGAKIDVAANEMKEFAPLVEESLSKINRTQYPGINKIMNAWERGSGGEDVIQLGDYINALQNAYAQIVTRGGQSTEGARHKAEEVLNAAWSKGQIKSGIDALMKEADAAMRATSRASSNVVGRVGGSSEGGGQSTGAQQPTVSNW